MSRKIHGKVGFSESWLGEMIVIKRFVFYVTMVLLTLQEWV